MDVAVEVAKMVMESRGGAVPSSVLLEAERIISMEAPLSVQTFIAHERCQRAVNSNCANAQLVEVWTIALRRNCPKEEKVLLFNSFSAVACKRFGRAVRVTSPIFVYPWSISEFTGRN